MLSAFGTNDNAIMNWQYTAGKQAQENITCFTMTVLIYT